MNGQILAFAAFFSILSFLISDAYAANPNLFVSAENPRFDNHFAGSMVIEVIVRDPSLNDTDEGKGEPDVTLNGKTLRMIQASDGNWYAYFANVDKAKVADEIAFNSGIEGEGLDFGVFCSRNTNQSVFGISLSETDGFAIPRNGGIVGFTNGDNSFNACTGTLTASNNINNVVRNPRSINTNSNIPTGQIGLDPNAWPLIQLFSFDRVVIQYNAAGGSQSVSLDYDETPNISLNLDREIYPENSEVFVTINDLQLNQDPTSEDSWTFNVNSPISTFYQAYHASGSDAANGDTGLVNLVPYLSSLGFENNGYVTMNLGDIIELKTNDHQPDDFVTTGTTNFSQIITLVENGPNSGIFESFDDSDESTIGLLNNAPRGKTGIIEYNKQSKSILSGTSTASINIEKPSLKIGTGSQILLPGTKIPITVFDPDQNLNTGSRDDLDIFRDTSIIPSLKIGNPITLDRASQVEFYSTSVDALGGGSSALSSIPDNNSARLFIDTSNVPNGSFEKISFNLGVSSSNIQSVLVNPNMPNTFGTNWLNYDLRSFQNDLGINNFSDTSILLYFNGFTDFVTIADSGDITSAQGFIQIDDSTVQNIFSKTGPIFVVINFDDSNNSSTVGTISNESHKQPIVFDFFSFGFNADSDINNSIYRFELEETSANSSTFVGTIEYAIANQLNILDSTFIRQIRPISDDIELIITNRLVDERGIAISYSDLAQVGIPINITTKSDINTHSGIVSTDSNTYRFGRPVTITLNDPDLNLKSDNIDIYSVIDNPSSPYVDTVGKDNNVLLEILIKDIRYQRCTINGVEHGGLASTGFTLVETGKNTGIFSGVFKMPSQICDKTGTKLISSAGGNIDVKYHDSRDSSGNPNIFTLSRQNTPIPEIYSTPPHLSSYELYLPSAGEINEITLTGTIGMHNKGTPLQIYLVSPNGKTQSFTAIVTDSGTYKTVFSINSNSLSGTYQIRLIYSNIEIGTTSFTILTKEVPTWIKNNAGWWSSNQISDAEFISGIEHLIKEKIISIPEQNITSSSQRNIPDWVKNTAKWWFSEQISDQDFLNAIEYLVKTGIIRV